MRGILAGLGAREVLEAGGTGSVVASFRGACYVRVGDAQVALVGPGVHPGPVHLVLDGEPPRPEPGRPVDVSAGKIVVGGTSIDVTGVADWLGEVPAPGVVRRSASRIAAVAEPGAWRSALRTEPFAAVAGRGRALLEAGRLEEATGVLGGLGPGLTPSGDDALVGIVFGLRAALGPVVERAYAGVSRSPAIGGFARAALAFAARGQALAPVHAMVMSVARGDETAGEAAANEIVAVGETSGSDLLEGLVWTFAGNAVYAVAASLGLDVEPATSAR